MCTDEGIVSEKDATPSGQLAVSVVVPVYNPGEYFPACLDSLLSQTLDPAKWEVILVDDGSTDGSGQVCDAVAAAHPDLFRVLHQENSGWASAPRNHGMELARGEYLYFHDSDDVLMPQALELMVAHASEWGSDFLVLREALAYPDGTEEVVPPFAERGECIPDADRFAAPIVSHIRANALVRRSMIQERGIRFEKTSSEDFLFCVQCILASDTVSFAADYTYSKYVIRDRGSLSSAQESPAKSFDGRLRGIAAALSAVHAAGAEREAYPYFYEVLFRHPVYKMLTTRMDESHWDTEKHRLGELRAVLAPYWNLDRADLLQFTERAVLELLMIGEYDAMPGVRALAKSRPAKGEGLSVKADAAPHPRSADRAQRVPDGLTHYVRHELVLRQLRAAKVQAHALVLDSGAVAAYGSWTFPRAVADPDAVTVSFKGSEGEGSCKALFAFSYEEDRGVCRQCGFWYAELPLRAEAGMPQLQLKADIAIGGDVASSKWAKPKGRFSAVRFSQGEDFLSRVQAARRMAQVVCALPDGAPCDLFRGLLAQGTLYPAITTSIDAGRWDADAARADLLREVARQVFDERSARYAGATERAVLQALLDGRYGELPAIRRALKDKAKAAASGQKAERGGSSPDGATAAGTAGHEKGRGVFRSLLGSRKR